ncbi:hypothetical protein LTR47_001239 [Exophiala xenobiotica]|nr:hypothetical protein LTR92_002804 [Exophiala xenobiotica]KAK5238146.1 hypothetical protein LTR47_001239 [Exophiala xenobiotica]KAK5241006.1 hypothetical protein LTS06_012267 [Exophiala xenobiotica]KAK5255521.1 hypothetical protein LTR40_010848 [Exophiala xenobiotica]KAK5355898.1 hypothetical protein LTR61_001571 [Exophiala xenobiotica]
MGQILSNIFRLPTTATALHGHDTTVQTKIPNRVLWFGQARCELPLGPKLDHSHAFGGKYSSGSAISRHLRLVQFPKPKNAQFRAIIQLFVEVAVKERDRCTTEVKRKRMAGPGAVRTPMQDIDEARLIFFRKNIAVLESIKVGGEMKRSFEEWIANDEADDDRDEDIDLPFLSAVKDIRLRAQELLDDLLNNPVPDMADLLEMDA